MVSAYNKLREKLQDTFDYWNDDLRNQDVCAFYYNLEDVLKVTTHLKLFRYTPATIYNLRNFEKQTIFLSPNGMFNDIYEGLPSDDLSKISSQELSLLNDSAYITCFSEKCDSMLMWSHYADSHRGFCVEYDLNLLQSNSEILKHIYPVLYHKNRRHVSIQNIISSMQKLNDIIYHQEACTINIDHLLTLFTIKGSVWEYEREWRVIYTKKDLYDKNQTNHIPKSSQILSLPCVSGIYLGYRIDTDMRENILEIAERLGNTANRKIQVYEPFLANANYKIGFKKIN